MESYCPNFFSRDFDEFGGKISFILTDIVEQLRLLKGYEQEGIFRRSGSTTDQEELCNLLNKGKVTDWSKFQSINTLACTLKKYFRDHVQISPLIPNELVPDFLKAPKIKDAEKQKEEYIQLIQKMSPYRQKTLAYLFDYLLEVISHEDMNKMHAQNIATVFAPNLINFDPEDPMSVVQVNGTIKAMLLHGKSLFEGIVIDESSVLTEDDIRVISKPSLNTKNLSELYNLAKKSVIPFIPSDVLASPNFSFPVE